MAPTGTGAASATVAAVVVAALVAAATAPLGQCGSCPDAGDCVILTTNIVLIPVSTWLWIPASIVAGALTWWLVHRAHVHRARTDARLAG